MKRMIVAGKNFSVNTKKDENPAVIDWLNSQSNLSDSIRFLIEQDIVLYGVRNLQQVIPAERGYNSSEDRPVLIYNIVPDEVKGSDAAGRKDERLEKGASSAKDIEKKGITQEVIDSWE